MRVVTLLAATVCLSTGVSAAGRSTQSTVTIDPAVIPPAMVGKVYRVPIATSGPAPRYTLRVTQGGLPPGLSLTSGGVLAGTPTSSGMFAFTIAAFTPEETYVAFRDYVTRVALPTRQAGPAYFADDFENGLGKWNLWGTASSYSLVQGRRGQAASITVGPSTTGPTSSVSEIASLWLDWPAARADAGQRTWYAAKVRFPVGYRATTGQWNWFMSWHNDETTGSYPYAYSPALGVYTDYPIGAQPGRNPRLAFRLLGGPVTSPQKHTVTLPPNSLRLGWWYDIVVGFVWSANADEGLAELWLDGKRVVSKRFPTLYRHPSGATSYNGFGLYNYRPKATWDASIHFDRVRIGPTRASVADKTAKLLALDNHLRLGHG